MAKINLLPWREELRKQRQIDFLASLGAGILVTIVIMFGIRLTYEGLIENQNKRNAYLQTEISALDKKIKEIKELEKTKSRLISRMEVIQKLQSSRPAVVHMFDQLAKTVPEGVFLTSFTQSNNRLLLQGNAQSNARVSAYMRKLEGSPWLKGTNLSIIQAKGDSGGRVSGFNLTVTQTDGKQKVKDDKEEAE